MEPLTKKQIKELLHAFGLNYSGNYNRILQTLLSSGVYNEKGPDCGWVCFRKLKEDSGLSNRTTLCRSLTSLEDHNIIERRFVSFYDYEKGAPNTIKEFRLTEQFISFFESFMGEE